MHEPEIRQAIVEALTELGLGDEPSYAGRLTDPAADVTFEEIDIDSLSAAEVSTLVEDKTGVPCDIGDFAVNPSINALAAQLSERRAEPASG